MKVEIIMVAVIVVGMRVKVVVMVGRIVMIFVVVW